jgi:S1-C subfamily serine protease
MRSTFKKTFMACVALAVVQFVSPLPARAADDIECADGHVAIGYIGITGLECNCTVSGDNKTTRREWLFRSEPRILRTHPQSPAGRLLLSGDVIVSINNHLITTKEAGILYGSPPPLEQLDIVVRRDGATVTVPLFPEAVCPDDPRINGVPEAPRAPSVRAVDRAKSAYNKALSIREPEAPMPPIPDAQDLSMLPRGWLGMGISCSDCVIQMDENNYPGWQFSSPPEVYSVDANSPADRAGIERGDVLTHIDGIPLVHRDGAERFSEIAPGQETTWTIERGGKPRVVRMTAEAPRVARAPRASRTPPSPATPAPVAGRIETLASRPRTQAAPEPAPVAAPEPHQLRFTGSLGNTAVDVWGISSVVVSMDEERGEIIIRTGDATIRLRASDLKELRSSKKTR